MLEPNSTDFDFFLERCLYEYHENTLLLENKRWERDHLPLFSNPGGERVDGGDISDPVAVQYLRLETLEDEIVSVYDEDNQLVAREETVAVALDDE